MRLGPEWIGKVPPGNAEGIENSLRSWRESGVVDGVEVLPPSDCLAAQSVRGIIFPLGEPPQLPFPGCVRKPCCACCFVAVLTMDGSNAPKLVQERAGYSLSGAGLPPDQD
jgi:hypothetical protein